MCIWRPTREFLLKQINFLQHGKCFPTAQAIKTDMCGVPLLCDFVAPPTRVARVYFHPSDFELGYVFCFGQWNVSGHDGSRDLEVCASSGLPPGLGRPTFNHKNVSWVSRSNKNEKPRSSSLQPEVQPEIEPLQLTHRSWRLVMKASEI